jgi:hypothetical protein
MKKLTKGDIPEGFNYAAVDSDGYAYAYENKPTLYYKLWIYGGKIVHLGVDFEATNWTDSLISIND